MHFYVVLGVSSSAFHYIFPIFAKLILKLERKIQLLQNQLMSGNMSHVGRICSSLGYRLSFHGVLTMCKLGACI